MSRRTIYILILVVIAFLFATTAYVAMLITIRQEALWKTTRYEDPWVVSQALVELTRLEQRISAFGLPWTGVDKEEVELRFDILQGRLQLFREGEIQDFIQRDPERRKVQDQLAAAIAAAEPLIKQIERPGSAQKLLAILAPVNHQLAFLTTAAFTFDGERVAEDQRNLTRLHLVFAALLGALAVSGLALIGFLYWHNRALEQARKDMSRSAAAAREARHRFEITLENMNQGILMYDASGVIRVYNTKAVELLDLPEELMASPRSKLSESTSSPKASFREATRASDNGLPEAASKTHLIHMSESAPTEGCLRSAQSPFWMEARSAPSLTSQGGSRQRR